MEVAVIFVGIAFWLVYFSTTFENDWIKLFLKLFSTFVVAVAAYIPLIDVGAADQEGLYSLFAFSIMNGLIFFWALWFVILFYELFMFFLDKKKSRMEGIQ